MDQDAYDAQQDREQAREALTQKIELLEERVRDSVEEAKAVFKQKLRVSYHVNRRPWQMVGLSILTGFVIGRVLGGHRGSRLERDENFTLSESKGLKKRVDPDRDGMSTIKGAAAGIVTSVAVQLLKEGMAVAAAKVRKSGFRRRGVEEPATESFDRDFR